MEIQEQTATKLIIYSKPVGIWLFVGLFFVMELYMFFFGFEIPPKPDQQHQWLVIPFMGFTLFFFYSWLTIIKLTLNKETGTLKLEKRLLTQKILEKPLTEISKLELSQSNEEGKPIHPVYLVLQSGEKLPAYSTLGWFSDWDGDQQKVSEAITHFLELPQT